jgi:hypothetical protein
MMSCHFLDGNQFVLEVVGERGQGYQIQLEDPEGLLCLIWCHFCETGSLYVLG